MILCCRFIAPVEGVGLLVWWIAEEIANNGSTWWQFQSESLAVVLTEWAVVLLVLIGLNWWMGPLAIQEPRDRNTKRVLGFFFKLTPRQQRSHEDLEHSRSPEVPVSQLRALCAYTSSTFFSLFSPLYPHPPGLSIPTHSSWICSPSIN